MKKTKSVIAGILVTILLFNPQVANAAENLTPEYEVKLLLDEEQVMNSENLLKKTYRNLFNTGKEYETVGVMYIDTEELEFNLSGWTNRIRKKENADKFDLTYKKRYQIVDGKVDDALSLANMEGFDADDTNYDAQIEWGYSNMTLSLSRNKTYSDKGYKKLEMPAKTAAIKMLKEEMPGKENDWNGKDWGTDLIEAGKKYGELYYKKYSGEYNQTDIDIEIWGIESNNSNNLEYIVELSFKAKDYSVAEETRSSLIQYLDRLGILLHKDSLKTKMVLGSY